LKEQLRVAEREESQMTTFVSRNWKAWVFGGRASPSGGEQAGLDTLMCGALADGRGGKQTYFYPNKLRTQEDVAL
jgi:hypothetical protein